jgi:Leucine-rich repeat (LRR) protein
MCVLRSVVCDDIHLTEFSTLQIRHFGGVERFDLSVCTWLQQLSINGCQLYELASSIGLLTDLMELDLSNNRFTSIDAIDFTQMSKLTSLNVSIPVVALINFNYALFYR